MSNVVDTLPDPEEWPCDYCSEVFETDEDLMYHEERFHPDELREEWDA